MICVVNSTKRYEEELFNVQMFNERHLVALQLFGELNDYNDSLANESYL